MNTDAVTQCIYTNWGFRCLLPAGHEPADDHCRGIVRVPYDGGPYKGETCACGDPERHVSEPVYTAEQMAADLIPALEAAADDAAVLEIMTGVPYDVFMILDEQPGLFDRDYRHKRWHINLRQCRNDPSNDLFDRLKR